MPAGRTLSRRISCFNFLDSIIFVVFFLSGFCGLLYQIVWLRIAYSHFGVITPVMSVVISAFMFGLGIGSIAGGKWIAKAARGTRTSAILFYGISEICIGTGAFLVPMLFSAGTRLLLSLGEMNSLSYLFFSGLIITVSILPFCLCMGFTYPFMMAFLKERSRGSSTFSFLYVGNVIGALFGTVLTALVLIEILGFQTTLAVAAVINFLIAIIACALYFRYPCAAAITDQAADDPALQGASHLIPEKRFTTLFLFASGFISMALEVVWTRAFTPILKTTIYAFATLLAIYLLSTWIGSFMYRRHLLHKGKAEPGLLFGYLAAASLLPLILNDPRFHPGVLTIGLGLFPFCALLGYITPCLIDRYSAGSPRLAGKAYGINIAGCILGPLAASYVCLPLFGVKYSMFLAALCFILFFIVRVRFSAGRSSLASIAVLCLSIALLCFSWGISRTFEDADVYGKGSEVRRDYAATVVSSGSGLDKRLWVNGVTITFLTPLTKIMAHLPCAFLEKEPRSALNICLGMGTTFRSLLSWDIDVTAVDLIPGVKKALGFYYGDLPPRVDKEGARVIIDDGRRYLGRTRKQFDVITIDPPPPIQTAGSSFLYSEEFYRVLKPHLTENGILQQWFPGGDEQIRYAVARSLANSFAHIKVYSSGEGDGGRFFLAADHIITTPSVETIVSRIPAAARKDLMEMYPDTLSIRSLVQNLLNCEISPDSALTPDRRIVITDDRPFNEYFLIRWLREGIFSHDDDKKNKLFERLFFSKAIN